MKRLFYTGIVSSLILGCAATKIKSVDYPVIVDEREREYTMDSNHNCTLKIPDLDGKTWYLHDQGCKGVTDSVSIVSSDHNLLYLRHDLTPRTRRRLDRLLQDSVELFDKNYTTRSSNGFFL